MPRGPDGVLRYSGSCSASKDETSPQGSIRQCLLDRPSRKAISRVALKQAGHSQQGGAHRLFVVACDGAGCLKIVQRHLSLRRSPSGLGFRSGSSLNVPGPR